MRPGICCLAISLVFIGSATAGAQVRHSPATRTASFTATEVRAIHGAFRASLRNVAIRDAVRNGVRQQLRNNRPIAFVDGYWVTPLDLTAIYAVPGVRAGIRAELRGHVGATRLDDLAAFSVVDRLGLAFTPNLFADLIIGVKARDIRGSLAQTELLEHTTDVAAPATLGGVIVVSVGTGIIASLIASALYDWYTSPEGPIDQNTGLPIDDPNADPDGDGTPNRLDGDDDADGTPDDEDSAPYDPDVQICYDCASLTAVTFTNTASANVLKTAVSAFNETRTMIRARNQIALGSYGRVGNQLVAIQIGFAANIR